MHRASWIGALAGLLTIGCGPSSQAPEPQPPAVSATPPSTDSSRPVAGTPAAGNTHGGDLVSTLRDAIGAAPGGGAPGNIEADGDCPILYPPPDDEIAAQAQAVVPLKAGLTLTKLWRAIDSKEEIECLSHVEAVNAEAVHVSNTCLRADAQDTYPRRTCRTDMRRSRVIQTMVGTSVPETILGATSYSLSRDAFLEVKRQGKTSHRYIELKLENRGPMLPGGEYQARLEGSLSLDGTGTLTTLVNDAPTNLPVLRLSGTLKGTLYDKPGETRVSAAVIDDERFPLLLEYRLMDLGAHEFSVRYTKISYPTENVIEKRLTEAKRVDVYGIYFDFASDTIRKESESVLKEIADALKKNGDWTLNIAGHTDNVGSEESNLDLSQRRSAAVRTALVQRHGIAAERLGTAGFGEGAPKDSNETPEGRARNRRVELVRQ